MKRKQQVTKTESSHLKRRRAPRLGRRRKPVNLRGLREQQKQVALHAMKIADFYRPLKKPVTLRLDADVIAWFKKDGKRYQTRINQALRKVMEREIKAERG
jgi:uncharacterized protein (DUF4415 family)